MKSKVSNFMTELFLVMCSLCIVSSIIMICISLEIKNLFVLGFSCIAFSISFTYFFITLKKLNYEQQTK